MSLTHFCTPWPPGGHRYGVAILCLGVFSILANVSSAVASEIALPEMTIQSVEGASAQLEVPASEGLLYHVESSSDLAQWSRFCDFTGTGGMASYRVSVPEATPVFYRYSVSNSGPDFAADLSSLDYTSEAEVTVVTRTGLIPALHFTFNETFGSRVLNYGTGHDAVMLAANGFPQDARTAAGGGVSGRVDDRAIDMRGNYGSADITVQTPHDFGDLTRFTLCGWYFIDPGDAAMGSRYQNLFRYEESSASRLTLHGANSSGRLNLTLNGVSHLSSNIYATRGEWVFFAVSYDGESATDTARIRWYVGNKTTPIEGAASTTDAAVHSISVGNQYVGVGNAVTPGNARIIDGLLDEFRFYPDAVLSASDIEAVRLEALQAPPADGGSYLLLNAEAPGESIRFTMPGLSAGVYTVALKYRTGPDCGIFQASLNGTLLGDPVDAYAPEEGVAELTLGTQIIEPGDALLELELVGKNAASGGYSLAVDTLALHAPVATAPLHWEAEALVHSATDTTSISNVSGAAGARTLLLQANGTGDAVSFVLTEGIADSYGLKVGFHQKPSFGIVQLYLNGEPFGQPIDTYTASSSRLMAWSFDPAAFASSENTLEFRVVGKNPSSSGYALSIDYIELFPEPDYVQVVKDYANALITYGRDQFGVEHSNLLVSILDRDTLLPFPSHPPTPGGVRDEDRAARVGSNVNLQQNLLRAFYVLTQLTGDSRYQDAVEAALLDFSTLTQSPVTDLYAWGEHLSWDLWNDTLGVAFSGVAPYHEPKRKLAFWDELYALNPSGVEAYALGIWDHQIANQTTGDFSRHARWPVHGPGTGADFPKEASYFIDIWSRAYLETSDSTFLAAIEVLCDRYTSKLNELNLIDHSAGVPGFCSPVENLSLTVECSAAADRLPAGGLQDKLRTLAANLDDGFLNALAHRVPTDGFVYYGDSATGEAEEKETHGTDGYSVEWELGYGRKTDAMAALMCYERYKQLPDGTEKSQYRTLILQAADKYLSNDPDLGSYEVWAGEYGLAAFLQIAAYRMTEQAVYLERADHFARQGWQLFWTPGSALPRATSQKTQYEEIALCDTLALAMLAVYAEQTGITVDIPIGTIDR